MYVAVSQSFPLPAPAEAVHLARKLIAALPPQAARPRGCRLPDRAARDPARLSDPAGGRVPRPGARVLRRSAAADSTRPAEAAGPAGAGAGRGAADRPERRLVGGRAAVSAAGGRRAHRAAEGAGGRGPAGAGTACCRRRAGGAGCRPADVPARGSRRADRRLHRRRGRTAGAAPGARHAGGSAVHLLHRPGGSRRRVGRCGRWRKAVPARSTRSARTRSFATRRPGPTGRSTSRRTGWSCGSLEALLTRWLLPANLRALAASRLRRLA